MGMDIGKVSIEYFARPQGLAYEFLQELACEAGCVGEGNAFGFYLRSDVEEKAKRFAQGNKLAEQTVMEWIASLPWDEDGHLTLTFSW